MKLLEVKNLGISFGGVKAVEDVSFDVKEGSILSVIGPNGAGKSTLFNMISGVYQPMTGRVIFDEEDITGMAPFQMARRGLSRTFQNLQIFSNMTVLENVACGFHLQERGSLLADLLRLPSAKRRVRESEEKAMALLERLRLDQAAHRLASALSYGSLKRLEIARALALKPRLLLLDEPAAGCNAVETEEIERLVAEVAQTGIAILLVEHDMKMVMRISKQIVVLDHGEKIAEGSPREVAEDPRVIAAYLGVEAAEKEKSDA